MPVVIDELTLTPEASPASAAAAPAQEATPRAATAEEVEARLDQRTQRRLRLRAD